MNKSNSKWVCTDPDEDQYGRRLDWFLYEFKDSHTEICTINLCDYNSKTLRSYASTYGYKFFEEKCEEYSFLNILWLLAEIAFEMDYSRRRYIIPEE